MKADEFYAELKSLLNKGFKLTKATKDGIEDSIRFYKDHKTFCPITAVCYDQIGKYYHTDDWDAANKHLKLHSDTASSIIDAADWGDSSPRVRKKMNAALGL